MGKVTCQMRGPLCPQGGVGQITEHGRGAPLACGRLHHWWPRSCLVDSGASTGPCRNESELCELCKHSHPTAAGQITTHFPGGSDSKESACNEGDPG